EPRVSATGVELIDLIARWVHLIAGIMWIGNSLLFNWLDRNLVPPAARSQTPDPAGTIWLLHSGGFYYVEKTLLAGMPYPARMHWFKYQAYTTWWSGLVLLLAVYWVGGRAALADAGVAPLRHLQAVGVGAGAILAGWAVYESMNRWVAPRRPRLAAAVWILGLLGIAIALTQLLTGRAAFLHVGAMLGTLMAANVALTIVPSQRALVETVVKGEGGSAALSARAKRVSIHNNYFTFPVIVLMVIGHFPAVYGHPRRWLLLLVLIAGGALVRHLLNIRFGWPAWRPALAGAILATIAALFVILKSGSEPAPLSTGPVTFADVRHIIDRRCGACHSANQADPSFGPAPGGAVFDTPEQILSYAARIRQRAVITRSMPPANKTRITDAERGTLGGWNGKP
ncbi:MAG TPA: urate hydroxylase PuuD, partial [Gemmatimonadales bacterium]|nr:urate hydroxylase PuuD [Gemmatimonadales bacterium]